MESGTNGLAARYSRGIQKEKTGGQRHLEGPLERDEGQDQAAVGNLTDDEIAQAEGNRDELVGKIQQKYGGTKEEIRRRLDEF